MSLITCCPACGTMFRVVPDQLKISEGWVRCGHCAEVFDATSHMVGEPALRAAQEEIPPAPPLEADTQPADEQHQFETIPTNTPPLAPPPAQEESLPRESALDQPFVFRRSDLGEPDAPSSLPPPAPDSQSAPQSRPARLASEEDDEASHDVSFIRQSRPSPWTRPGVRAMLALLVLLLGAVLVLQFAVHERDRLAAADPALKPWLDQLCEVAGCRVEPLRQIEALAIEASSFNKLRTDAYRLAFTLKNNSPLEVAVPAMELTLTDGQDQPLLRRVLTPAELGARAPVLVPGADWSASVAIAVSSSEPAPRIAGYRLLAFYP
ncbi:MAG: DUF3426 domain-containing protein [Burkholderiales bacterium]|nr:DUF3426 domain-containing protein [Burkholderiales bacterium]